MRAYAHAREIPDARFIAAVRVCNALRPGPATRWDVAAVLAGDTEKVVHATYGDMGVDDYPSVQEYPAVPSKVVLAKARRLLRRGVLAGCACGCRGDFEVTGMRGWAP